MNKELTLRSLINGCLLGGAIGDAFGSAVQALPDADMRHQAGLPKLETRIPDSALPGAVSAITQMTLFTAEGLVIARTRGVGNDLNAITQAVYQAYLRWLMTQDEVSANTLLSRHGTCAIVDGILTGFQAMHNRRRPDAVNLQALKQGRMGSHDQPLNRCKGAGAIARGVPIGLVADEETAFDLASAVAATTHGHPSAYLAAGCLGQIIAGIARGKPVLEVVGAVKRRLGQLGALADECLSGFERLSALLTMGRPDARTLASLGRDGSAVEVLTIGLYCTLAAGNDFSNTIAMATRHSGATAYTGAVAGSISGVLAGDAAIPRRWVKALELRALILEMAGDLEQIGQLPRKKE